MDSRFINQFKFVNVIDRFDERHVIDLLIDAKRGYFSLVKKRKLSVSTYTSLYK